LAIIAGHSESTPTIRYGVLSVVHVKGCVRTRVWRQGQVEPRGDRTHAGDTGKWQTQHVSLCMWHCFRHLSLFVFLLLVTLGSPGSPGVVNSTQTDSRAGVRCKHTSLSPTQSEPTHRPDQPLLACLSDQAVTSPLHL